MTIILIVSLTILVFGLIIWGRMELERLQGRLEERINLHFDAMKERDEWKRTAEIYHQQARDFHEQLKDALEDQKVEEVHAQVFSGLCHLSEIVRATHGRN